MMMNEGTSFALYALGSDRANTLKINIKQQK